MSSMKKRGRMFQNRFNTVERYILKSTSPKLKPIKPKHLKVLTNLTWQNDVAIDVFFELIMTRIRDANWVGVFKSLILIHFLINQGHTDKVLAYLLSNPSILLNSINFRNMNADVSANIQSKNIRSYATYLNEKVNCYPRINDDFVRSKADFITKFRTLEYNVKNVGLLDHVEALQSQINLLLACSFYLDEIDNIVTLQSFRLLICDAMALFHLLNEGVIRILSHYFEMERPFASRALEIYKSFAKQTTKTVEMFEIARKLRGSLGVDVPAPVSLAGALEEYLNSPDFEAQRLAYKLKKAQKDKPVVKDIGKSDVKESNAPHIAVKNADPNFDFFSSLDDAVNSHYSPTTQAIYNNVNYIKGDPFSNNQQIGQPSNALAGMVYPQQFLNIHQPFGNIAYEVSQPQQLESSYYPLSANPFQPQQLQQQQQAVPQMDFTIENVFGNNSAVFAPHQRAVTQNATTSNQKPINMQNKNFTGGALDPFALTSGTNASRSSSPFQNHPQFSPALSDTSFRSANQPQNFDTNNPMTNLNNQFQNMNSGSQAYSPVTQQQQLSQMPLAPSFPTYQQPLTSNANSFNIPAGQQPTYTNSPLTMQNHAPFYQANTQQQPFTGSGVSSSILPSQPQYTTLNLQNMRPPMGGSGGRDAFAGLNPFGIPAIKPTDGMTLAQINSYNLSQSPHGMNNSGVFASGGMTTMNSGMIAPNVSPVNPFPPQHAANNPFGNVRPQTYH